METPTPMLSEDERRAQIMTKLAEAQAARAAQQAAVAQDVAQKANKFGVSGHGARFNLYTDLARSLSLSRAHRHIRTHDI